MAGPELAIDQDIADIVERDEAAWERGREFLEKVQRDLGNFSLFNGRGIPDIGSVGVDIKPGLNERMFFKIRQSITQYQVDGIEQDGTKHSRRRDNLINVPVTEAESGIIRISSYAPGQIRGIMTGKLKIADPNHIEEAGYFAVQRVYSMRDLGRLSVAVINAHYLM